MAEKEFDVFVIGTGTAGKTVAKDCAAKGLKVGIADKREFGGTCPNRGCDPKKVLIGLAGILDSNQKMMGKGITAMPQFSWQDLIEFKKNFTEPIPDATEKDLKGSGIAIYHGTPYFLNQNKLRINAQTINADKIVIATGQKPRDLEFPGSSYALLSEDFLKLSRLPESMIFIGGGYVAMEFAHIAVRFGVKVTIIQSASRVLTNFDKDMVLHLQKASEEAGIKFIFNAQARAIEKLEHGYRVKAKKGETEVEEKAEMVFNTAGRTPSIKELDLEKAGVTFSEKGILVNQFLQNPGNKNVYACGDVAASDGLPLTPLSSKEAKTVSANIINEAEPRSMFYPPQASVVFSLPNLASVGFTEEEAIENDMDFKVDKKLVSEWFNARRLNEKIYAYKIITDKHNDQIIGAHLVGPQAAETINLFSLAISRGLDSEAIKYSIFSYPSWGSDIQSMV